MAAPGSLPEWASSGDKAVPTAGKKASGWLFKEKPSRLFFNWWMNLVYLWVVHVRYWGNQHNDTDGSHGVVTAQSVTVRTGGDSFFYEKDLDVRVPIGADDWRSNQAWLLSNGPPLYLVPSSTGAEQLYAMLDLEQTANIATNARYLLVSLDYTYSRLTADTLTIAVKRQLRASPYTESTVATVTPTATAGTMTVATLSLSGIAYDPDYNYFVEVQANPDAAAVDVKIGPMGLNVLAKIVA